MFRDSPVVSFRRGADTRGVAGPITLPPRRRPGTTDRFGRVQSRLVPLLDPLLRSHITAVEVL
jgi:hypothetical protein